jgi:hypothetical protein
VTKERHRLPEVDSAQMEQVYQAALSYGRERKSGRR